MTIYAWPTTAEFMPEVATLRVYDKTQRVSESELSGDVQTVSMPGARWGWDLDFGVQYNESRAALEAYLIKLNGREHRVTLWDIKKPAPRGSINLTGVTTSAAASIFAESITLAGCGANTTLKAADWFSVGGQLLMAVEDAQANGAGVMTVAFRHRLRAGVAAGAAVTLVKPTARFIRTESDLSLQREMGVATGGTSVSFIEAFA